MGKPYYADMARHMWRFYIRYPSLKTDTDPVDRRNWDACNRVYNALSDRERDIARMYFSSDWGKDHDTVNAYAKERDTYERRIWEVIDHLLYLAAYERGLVRGKPQHLGDYRPDGQTDTDTSAPLRRMSGTYTSSANRDTRLDNHKDTST